jgi:CHAD domain-containing protein
VRPTTLHLRRRALRRLDEAIEGLGHVEDPEATHLVRTRCKEVRALLRLLRPAGSSARQRVDALVDGAGELLGTMRDAQVLADTLAALPAPLHVRPPSGHEADADATARATDMLRAAHDEVAGWRVGRRTGPILDGVTEAYRLARRRLAAVRDDPSDELVHEWRRAVKRLTYQVRAVRRWAPSVLRPYAARLDDLGSLLGEDHDLSNAVAHLEQHGAPEGSAEAAALQAARARQRVAREDAIRLGATLLAERPAAFRERLHGYVDARRAVGPERD